MQHEHGIHGGSETFQRPRWYEITTAIMFGGRRRRRYDDIIELSGAASGDRVLDVGCGPGYLARRAARIVGPAGRVEGIDPSREAIAYATRRAPANTGFTVAGAQRLPYPDASFDVVVSSLAVHHVDPEQRPVALAEMRRVLRPDGRLLIVEIRPSSGGPSRRLLGRVGHGSGHDMTAELADLLTDTGFGIVGQGELAHWRWYVQARPS